MRLGVRGMGCEACQAAVRGVLTASAGVLDARVHGTEEEGIAELYFHPRWGFDIEAIARAVRNAGFELDKDIASGETEVPVQLAEEDGAPAIARA
jgi:copper chaperone CopZ